MGRTSDARERLVESCQALMHEKGYTAVGVGEVCSRAGVNKGSFYHFFPSKQDLALTVIDQFGKEASSVNVRMTVTGDFAGGLPIAEEQFATIGDVLTQLNLGKLTVSGEPVTEAPAK